ncbi:MAG: hypothetical protein MUF15_14150 [Acidobacteria bacterium]|nr:hypothetical protein [Acidobacteriota bacterium]
MKLMNLIIFFVCVCLIPGISNLKAGACPSPSKSISLLMEKKDKKLQKELSELIKKKLLEALSNLNREPIIVELKIDTMLLDRYNDIAYMAFIDSIKEGNLNTILEYEKYRERLYWKFDREGDRLVNPIPMKDRPDDANICVFIGHYNQKIIIVDIQTFGNKNESNIIKPGYIRMGHTVVKDANKILKDDLSYEMQIQGLLDTFNIPIIKIKEKESENQDRIWLKMKNDFSKNLKTKPLMQIIIMGFKKSTFSSGDQLDEIVFTPVFKPDQEINNFTSDIFDYSYNKIKVPFKNTKDVKLIYLVLLFPNFKEEQILSESKLMQYERKQDQPDKKITEVISQVNQYNTQKEVLAYVYTQS